MVTENTIRNISSIMYCFFLLQLFSSLPSITDLLIYCDINVVSKCHLLAYVRFCIPFGMNRTILSSGILVS